MKHDFHCISELWGKKLGSGAGNLDLSEDLDKVSGGKNLFLLSCPSFLIYDIINTGIQHLLPVWKGTESISRCLYFNWKDHVIVLCKT